jgi:hypothetical protein
VGVGGSDRQLWSGIRVRVITSQSWFSENGTTAWMTSLLVAAPSLAPTALAH